MASLNDWPRRSLHRGHDPVLDVDLHRTGTAPLKGADDTATVGLLTQGIFVSPLINGTSANDLRNGTSGADKINRLGANDTLSGLGGNDTAGCGNDSLNGGSAADAMIGSTGNDRYVVDNSGDGVVETSCTGGTDAVTSSVSFTLGSNVESLTLSGSGAINCTGNSLDNHLNGHSGANKLSSLGGNDTIDRLGGNDSLSGNFGMDSPRGGSGNDTLDGGTNNDTRKARTGAVDILRSALAEAATRFLTVTRRLAIREGGCSSWASLRNQNRKVRPRSRSERRMHLTS